MRARNEACSPVVTMTDNNISKTTPNLTSKSVQGSPESIKSVISVSVDIRQQLTELLKVHGTQGNLRGQPILMIKHEDLETLQTKITSLIDDAKPHTVPISELSSLSSQLASAKLQLATFQNRAERAEFANTTVRKELENSEKILHKLKEDWEKDKESLNASIAKLKSDVKEAQAANKAAKADFVASKKGGDGDEELKRAHLATSQKVTELTNKLGKMQADKTAADNKVRQFEAQVVALSNEINIVKATAGLSTDSTFASIASKAGSAPVKLYNSIRKHMTSRALAFVDKAEKADEDDVKNKAYWLKNALNSSNYKGLKPYALLVEGMYNDICVINWESRKFFLPILDNIICALTGSGDPADPAEIEALLNSLDTSKIRMSKDYRKKGIRTLKDYIESGGNADVIREDDISILSDHEEHVEQFVKVVKERESRPYARKPEAKPEGKISFLGWLKISTTSKWESIKSFFSSKRKANFRDKTPKLTKLTLKLQKDLGFFGAVLAVPVAFLNFISLGYF